MTFLNVITMKSKKQKKVLKSDEQNEIFLTKSQIKEKFGVTDNILLLLGQPDHIKPNPHYKSAAPMKLFNAKKVEKFFNELDKDHPEILEKMRKKQEISKKMVKTKINKTLAIADEFLEKFTIEPYEVQEIPRLAKNQFFSFIWSFRNNTEDREWFPSNRANLSFIRHNLTNYEEILFNVQGRVGKTDAYIKTRNFMDEKILQDYNQKLIELQQNDSEIFEKILNDNENTKKMYKLKEEKAEESIKKLIYNLVIAPYDIETISTLLENQDSKYKESRFDIKYDNNAEEKLTPKDLKNLIYIKEHLTNYNDLLFHYDLKVGLFRDYERICKLMDEKIIANYYTKLKKINIQ